MKKILISLMAIALVIGLVGAGTIAYFSDEETSTGNTFKAGTLDLALTGGTPLPFQVTSSPGMAPGDTVTGTVTVINNGTLELRYAMTTTPDDGSILDEQLTVVITDPTPTQLYSGALSSAVIGNPAQGAQAGDRVLTAGASEVLTFTVTLPANSDNTYQGLSCTVNFVFNAEQTANNS